MERVFVAGKGKVSSETEHCCVCLYVCVCVCVCVRLSSLSAAKVPVEQRWMSSVGLLPALPVT